MVRKKVITNSGEFSGGEEKLGVNSFFNS